MRMYQCKKRLPKPENFPICLIYKEWNDVVMVHDSTHIWPVQEFIREDLYWISMRNIKPIPKISMRKRSDT